MPKEKSPFKGYSVAEVNRVERDSFVIIIGNDYYCKDTEYVFTLSQAEKHYDTLLLNILNTLDEGTVKQKTAAMKCLARLHILPLRIH